MADYGGLGKEMVTVRLGGGVDQANDPFLVDSPSVLGAENVRFDDRGALAKRYGHLQTGAAGNNANSVHDVAGTLAVWGPEGAWQRNEAESNWLTMNPCAPRPSRVLTDAIARGNDSLSRSDFAMVGSLGCVCWQNDTEETVHYQFVDFSSGRPQVLARKLAATIKGSPRLVVISSKSGASSQFVLVGSNEPSGSTGTLYACTYEVDDADYTFSTPVSLGLAINTVGATAVWDVCSKGSLASTYIVMTNPFAGDCLFTECNAAGATGTSQTAAEFRGYACTPNYTNNDVVAVGANEVGEFGMICDVPYALSATPVVNTLAILENTDANIRRATISQLDATGKMIAAYSGRRDVTSSSSTEFGLGTDIIEVSAGYTMTRQGFVRSMAIAAKAVYGGFLTGNPDDALLPLCENACETPAEGEGPLTNSPTLSPAPVGLLCRPELNAGNEYTVAVVGRFLVDAIAKAGDDFHLSHVASQGDDAYFTATVLTDIGLRGGTVLRKTQIDLVRANVWEAPACRSVTAQGLRLAAGGAGLVCFDGSSVAECTPPMVTVIGRTAQDPDYATGGTLLPLEDPGDAPGDWAGGTGVVSGYVPHYPIRLCHRWTDAKGNVHRGAPSDPYFLVPLNNAGDIEPHNPSFMIGFSAPEPSAMNGDRLQRMDVEVYQSPQPDQETWHRIAICKPRAHPTVPGWLSITALGPAVLATDRPLHGFVLQPGEALSGYPSLYTDSEAANMPPPPLLDLCSTQSRLWGLSAEKRLDVFYTKPIVANEAPAFYGASTPVPAEGGEAVGLAALDDKVIVFKERLVFALFGDPGDAMGDGSTLQTPRLVSGDVGCINALSIVEGPFGVAFLSERGFYTIDRGMGFSFIGETVKDALGGKVVTSGVLVPSESEVRWTFSTSSGGYAVVWNYLTNAWSVWSSFTAVHAALWRGVHTRVSSGGVAYVETPSDWTEGSDEEIEVTTAWLKLAGLQRYQRVRRALFLMRHFTGGVRIEVGYDYAPEWVDSVEWTPIELEALRASDGRVQLLVSQSIQKCEAIRYRITGLTTDGAQGYYPGQAIELVGIDLELGVKRGTFKSIATDAKR